MSKPAATRPRFTGLQKRVFALVALSLPFLLLGVLEVCLRLTGYGQDTAFFRVEREASGKNFLINNDPFMLRFFPSELARWPRSFRIEAEKPEEVRRIFILGESAAMGDPQPSVGASHILEILLREKFPKQKFQVINLGITAINSHVILPIAQEVAARGRGDLWIIYMGNNEMVGPFGAASAFGVRAAPLPLVRLTLALRKSRIGQSAVALQRALGGDSTNTAWRGMAMFLQNQVPPDDDRRETVYRNFDRNLRDIVQAGQRSKAKIVLCTVSVNLRDCPPFASLANSDLPGGDKDQFDTLYADAVRLQTNQSCEAATALFERTARIDPDYAELQFRWAQCLLNGTNTGTAKERFQMACDVDALPFRADSRVNQIIRSIASERASDNLVLCDAEAALAAAAVDGIAGDESFFEHVHFNFDGNYRLAKVWAEHIERLLPGDISRSATAGWASQDFCEREIGLSDWNRLSVISSVLSRLGLPPLTAQLNNATRTEVLQREWKAIRERQRRTNAVSMARAQFEAALARSPQDAALLENYGTFLESVGDREGALTAYSKVRKLLPHDVHSGLKSGQLLRELGRLAEAKPVLQDMAERRPSLPEPWYQLGRAFFDEGDYLKALECFDRVARIHPSDANCLIYKARALSRLNRRTEAMQVYRESIRINPDSWQAHLELAVELVAANEISAATDEYVEAVRLNPRHALMRVNLGVLLASQDRLNEAVAQFEAALSLDPNNTAASEYLRQVSARRDRGP